MGLQVCLPALKTPAERRSAPFGAPRVRRCIGILALVMPVAACERVGHGDSVGGPRHLRVDREVLEGNDAFAVIEPVYWAVNIYESVKEYEASLTRFSRPQRLLLAVHWYRAEVNNGGHLQFYCNSTGIVWRDALEGLELLGCDRLAAVLRESVARLGGEPPLERERREALLKRLKPAFDDLDDRFFELEKICNVDRRMLECARKRPRDFEFDGAVKMPAVRGG